MEQSPPRSLVMALTPVLLATFAHFAAAALQDPPLIVKGVTVHAMDGREPRPQQAVLVRGGVIEWVGPAEECPEPEGALVVDGQGGYLVPGLTDMHVHVQHVDEFLLYLANGVTTIANLSGTARHLDYRNRIRSGELLGPTLYTAGRTLDGDPPRNPIFQAVGDQAEAEALVRRQKADGYDFIKIYDLIAPECYDAVTAAAKAQGLAVVGHIPKQIGLEGVLAGHDLIAHAEEYFYTFFKNKADEQRIAEAARLTAKAGIAVIPNTGFIDAIIAQAEDIESVLQRPELRFLPPSVKVDWLPENNRYVGRSASWLARNKVMHPFLQKLTKGLHEAGVVILSGTDASIAGGVPGFAIHEELRELVECGLTPREALATVTVNPGRWIATHLGGAPAGRIAVGERADLVLLENDPLADLNALRSPSGIVLRGRWMPRAELMSAIEANAETYEAAFAPYQQFKDHLSNGRFDAAGELLRATKGAAGELLSENVLNTLGYDYLYKEEQPSTAIALLALVVERWPASWNAHDSLGEAYMVAGEKALAEASYEKSLELNAGNTNAREMLKRLSEGN